jgi:hypothetical protein
MKRTVSAGARDAVVLAEALHDAGGVGAHGVHGFDHRDEHKEAYDTGNDEKKSEKCGVVHEMSSSFNAGAAHCSGLPAAFLRRRNHTAEGRKRG